jgi:hypothetical protein
MYHQAGLLNCYLETVSAALIAVIRSGVVSLSQYVYARQCRVKCLYSNDLDVDSHEHL